eukprot:TRINITY_DN1440_c0_g1_i1.p1 TRINITY_DN1440_c0_g1~~TRINITY_DN1440_c0_g1_i1.p1  ORF type:complete len:479 (-),score=85.29 TRINITY_DN1440_c0_g1_i1:53-1489(-)
MVIIKKTFTHCLFVLCLIGLAQSTTWEDVDSYFQNSNWITNAGLYIGRNETLFATTKGTFSNTSLISVASASKMVTSTTIAKLIEAGILSLSDKPSKYLPYWTTNTSDVRGLVNVSNLLSFTSGCSDDTYTFANESCVMDLYYNSTFLSPGTFAYSGCHFAILGVMAMKATNLSNWDSVFQTYLVANTSNIINWTGSFFSPKLNPGTNNPAGSLFIQTRYYATFLRALLNNKVLPIELSSDFQTYHTNSLAPNAPGNPVGKPWRYGYGLWIECNSTYWSSECGYPDLISFSSPGKFGFYPFVDRKYNYWGIVAQQNGSLTDSESVMIGLEIRALIQQVLSPNNTILQPPTSVPTASPTDVPPSISPTFSPTQADTPTSIPVDVPTGSPTGSPTDSPTGSPTDSPTGSSPVSPPASPVSPPASSPVSPPGSSSPVSPPGSSSPIRPTPSSLNELKSLSSSLQYNLLLLFVLVNLFHYIF